MPGIAGIIGTSRIDPADIERMTRCMLHEPSYVSGSYANEDVGLCVGWVSHRGSFSDCMPLWNERRDICLVFSGEDFTRFGGQGREVSGGTPNYLIALYEKYGLQFIDGLNGWFSGLLIDLRKNVAVLFNDRYGLARIYWHQQGERFYFSSEAKSLLEILPDLRRLDMRGVAETFACGSVLQDRTLFEGISLLPGGSRWSFGQDGKVSRESYFSPQEWERQPALNCGDFLGQLKETYANLLPKYLHGDSVAVSLTAGLDSRLIMAWAEAPPGTLPCYTFGGTYRACADVRIAQRIASLCGQPHQTITIGEDFLAGFPSLAERTVLISDGTMDVTGAVELYANQTASRIAPVRLTGNYGSEIMRGYVALRPGRFSESLLAPEFVRSVRDVAATYEAERDCHPLTFVAFKQVPWHHYSRLSIEQSQLTLRSPFLDNDFVALMYRAPPELLSSKTPSLWLIKEGNHLLAKVPTDRGPLDGGPVVLGKVRKLGAEVAARAEYAYDYGMPQWLARLDHMASGLHLERLFLGRQKFYHFRVWYRDRLSRYLKDMLLDPRALSREYLQGRVLERMVDAHANGSQNWTREIHRLLTLELTQRLLIERR